MSNKQKWMDTVLWVLTAATFLITAVAVQFMADKVPMHYNASGEIDRYGSRYENYIFPVMILIFNIFWVVFISFFRKKALKAEQEKERKEVQSSITVLGYAAVGTTIMFLIMQCVFLMMAVSASEGQQRAEFDINIICNSMLAFLMVFLGNILPKTKRNSVVGVRTVWSMDNDTTWELSNRFGGKAMIVSGLLILIESFIIKGFASTMVELAIIIAMGVAMMVYSSNVYKKYGNNAKKHQ